MALTLDDLRFRNFLSPPLPQIRTDRLSILTKLNPNLWERGSGGEGKTFYKNRM